MIATATTTAKATARAVRIWIEGAKLNAAGFEPDAVYRVLVRETTITLIVKSHPWEFGHPKAGDKPDCVGDRRVTKATRNGKARPIIDLHSKEVAAVFPAGTKVHVRYQRDMIIFSKSLES